MLLAILVLCLVQFGFGLFIQAHPNWTAIEEARIHPSARFDLRLAGIAVLAFSWIVLTETREWRTIWSLWVLSFGASALGGILIIRAYPKLHFLLTILFGFFGAITLTSHLY